jgi:hypothetical protein
MNFYNQMKMEKDDWVIVNFKVPIKFFVKSLKGNIQLFHRKLTNSQSKIKGTSNRNFWKYIKVGLYRYFFTPSDVHFVYLLRFVDFKKQRIRELQVRISKIFAVKINVSPFEMMDEVDVMMLNLPQGIKSYKRIKRSSN